MTIDPLIHAARRDPRTGMAALVEAIRADPEAARARHAQLIALKESPRGKNWEGACAIEARLLTTLEAGLASANTAAPGVPAGERNV